MLDCSPLSWEPLDQFQPSSTYEGGPMPVWLALDEVIDPVSVSFNHSTSPNNKHVLSDSNIIDVPHVLDWHWVRNLMWIMKFKFK